VPQLYPWERVGLEIFDDAPFRSRNRRGDRVNLRHCSYVCMRSRPSNGRPADTRNGCADISSSGSGRRSSPQA